MTPPKKASKRIHHPAFNPSPGVSTSQQRKYEVVDQAVEMVTLIVTVILWTPINVPSQSALPCQNQFKFVNASLISLIQFPVKVKQLILEGENIDLDMLLPDRSEETFKMQIDINQASPKIKLVPNLKKTPLSLT
ncbi:hypothetical protein CHS0354_036737 [Potamilus streckersoni]|uniref:Uncharacterized protein n=1 Tax=Potamilus streckersoni TaxID=2493646 RepID=A0AAE0TCP1_9BIVA|nr:hypothetical protein CHS0354_036737 [Potamilus streckersoni]